MAIINGTSAWETLTGTSGNDTINGFGGGDFIYSHGGNDSLNGGDGGDSIHSEGGADTVDGGADVDAWWGDYHTATANLKFKQTGATSWTLSNGAKITNVEMIASLLTGSGADTFDFSTSQSDSFIDAGAGQDTLNINTTLYGGGGQIFFYFNDVATGSVGMQHSRGHLSGANFESVKVTTGAQDDYFTLRADAAHHFQIDGAGGSNLADVDLSTSTGAITFSLSVSPNVAATFGGNGSTLTNIQTLYLKTGSGNDKIAGGAGADRFEAGLGKNSMSGGGGDDEFTSLGVDAVDGGDGFDTWTGDYRMSSANLTFTQTGVGAWSLSNGTKLSGLEKFTLKTGSGDDTLSLKGPLIGDQTWQSGVGRNTLIADLSAETTSVTVRQSMLGPPLLIYVPFADNPATKGRFEASSIQVLKLTTGSGDDNVSLATSAFQLDGGAGDDHAWIDLSTSTSGINVNLDVAPGAAVVFPGGSTLKSFEHVGVFTGSGSDTLLGGTGDDLFGGGLGADLIDGKGGSDTASYGAAGSGVQVNLALTGPQNTVGAGKDTLLSIENLIGSRFNDVLRGNSGANVLAGGDGDDTLDGGAGIDTASYEGFWGQLTVDLTVKAAQSTGAGSDKLIGIENLIGGDQGDHLAGDSGANVLIGGVGADELTGRGGADVFLYRSVKESGGVWVDWIWDFGVGADKIDVSAIDADPSKPGNQAFHLGATAGHVGDLVVNAYDPGNNRTILTLFIDGDANSDAEISLAGDHHLMTAADFVL